MPIKPRTVATKRAKTSSGESRTAKNAKGPGVKTVNLALQGGGSHGAFTWGVLDRLLEEEALVIEGISGTSAGALNAAMVAQGMGKGGGRQGARDELSLFWHRIAEVAR